MGLIRAIIGAIVGSFIWGTDGFPLTIIIYRLPLSDSLELVAFWLLLGLVVGLISGSSIWGAASSIAIIPLVYIVLPFLFGGTVRSSKYIYGTLVGIGFLEYVFYLLLGAVIGGLISSRFSGQDDYIILRLKNA